MSESPPTGLQPVPPPIADGAARERAIVTHGSTLVQAPAGSGKTTLLAQRYLHLLAGIALPEQILALTFTRRAAQEMRERVMGALEAAAADACPAGMNRRTWELGRLARQHLGTLGIDVERHPARLRIETIDSFNAWLAGQLPVTAGVGGALGLVENAQPLYHEAARRALAHDEVDAYGAAVERVLALDDQRWHSLVTLIGGMLASRDRWLPLLAGSLHVTRELDEAQLARVREQLDQDLELLVARTLRIAEEAMGGEKLVALSALVHGAARRCVAARPDMAGWERDGSALRADAQDIARWRIAAGLLLTNEPQYRRRLTKHEGFPPGCLDKQPMLDLLLELEREPRVLAALIEIRALPAPRYDDEQWSRVREVARVLVLAAAHLADVFRERGAVDFPAVSMAALRALGTAAEPTDLGLRLDYRLQHILVDEFQDTSSAQLELVKLLTAGWQRGDGRSLFCVGDPMQSIYGFRQAEVRAFLELAEDGIGDVQFEVERLSSNFRSARVLVEWINHSFARILPRRDDRERGAIAFRASQAAVPPALQGGVTLQGFASRADEAQAIARVLAREAARHPEWRVAVLVRARSHAREIAVALRARGVAFRAVDLEPLQDRPVVRDLVMLVRALLHLGDRTAWLAVLRAPWAGLDLADLLTLARGSAVIWDAMNDAPLLARLSDAGRARCDRLRRVFEAAFATGTATALPRWVEGTWLALGGPACAPGADELDHARRVFVRLREWQETGVPDAADMAQSFVDLYAVQGGEAAVEIMTIHKSKGLEFDLVVVPALDRHTPRGRDQLLLAHEFARAGRDGLVLAARPGIGQPTDDLFEFLRYQTRDAAALEAQRLLYVACTRAKSMLVLTATVGRRELPDDAEGSPTNAARAGAAARAPTVEWKPRRGSLLAELWPVAGAQFAPVETDPAGVVADVASLDDGPLYVAALDAALPRVGDPSGGPPRDGASGENAAGDGGRRGGPLRRVPAGWSPPVAEPPQSSRELAASAPVREETPVFDWAGETARRVGSLVHAELQYLDLDAVTEEALRARGAQFRRWLALHGVPADRLEEAGARVIAALVAVCRDPRGRWILKKGYREELREHALSGPWHGEVTRVVFDRSFIDAGIRWVVDYKTSRHAGGNLDEFLDREVERYRPQLQRYAQFAQLLGPEPVRVGLYFPLMRAWREWDPRG